MLHSLFLAAVYFCAARFGLSLLDDGQQASLVWPPAGIAVAAVLLFGYRVWPGIFLGAFLAELSLHVPAAAALSIAVGNTLEALVSARLMRSFAGKDDYLEHLRGILGLFLLAAFAGTMISATVGATSLCLSGLQPWALYRPVWLTWWLGDAAGVLIVAPLLLAWDSPFSRPSLPTVIEATALLIVSVGVACITFFHLAKLGTIWIYPYAVFPAVTWVALRLRQRAVTLMICAISGVAFWVVNHHLGLFANTGPLANLPVNEALVIVQTYTMVVTMIGLTISAAMSECRQVEKQNRDNLQYLQNVIDHIPDPVLIKDRQHVLLGGNKALWALLNGSPEKLIGKDYFTLGM
jgi:integral membrane sensor domain MASE1